MAPLSWHGVWSWVSLWPAEGPLGNPREELGVDPAAAVGSPPLTGAGHDILREFTDRWLKRQFKKFTIKLY